MKRNSVILIPALNPDKELIQYIQELKRNGFDDIIVVNDGSLDNSLEILEEYAIRDERVVVLNKENGGVTSCRREGLANAQGKYIFFLALLQLVILTNYF